MLNNISKRFRAVLFVLMLTWCQFHQRFLRAFFAQIFGAKPNVTRENDVSTEKFVHKTLMKLTTMATIMVEKNSLEFLELNNLQF